MPGLENILSLPWLDLTVFLSPISDIKWLKSKEYLKNRRPRINSPSLEIKLNFVRLTIQKISSGGRVSVNWSVESGQIAAHLPRNHISLCIDVRRILRPTLPEFSFSLPTPWRILGTLRETRQKYFRVMSDVRGVSFSLVWIPILRSALTGIMSFDNAMTSAVPSSIRATGFTTGSSPLSSLPDPPKRPGSDLEQCIQRINRQCDRDEKTRKNG